MCDLVDVSTQPSRKTLRTQQHQGESNFGVPEVVIEMPAQLTPLKSNNDKRTDNFKSSPRTRSVRVSSEDQDLNGLTDEEDRLFAAVSFGKIHKVTSLIQSLRHTEVRDENSCTLLLHTARNASGEHLTYVIKLLVQAGSDVNAQDNQGMTSLMHVIRRGGGSVDAVRCLMRCTDCEPDTPDGGGNTALMYAATSGNLEALAILLFLPSARKHADVNARNHEGLTALDIAVSSQQDMVCQMLVEEGKADTSTVKDVQSFNSLYHSLYHGGS